MNLVILINSAQMFFRNFGLRQVKATLGHFAIELAGPNACQKIVRVAIPLEWLRSQILPQVPGKSIEAQIQGPLEVCAAVGQLFVENRLLCGPPYIAARDRMRFSQLSHH
jgi:hypothetical protein